MASGKNSGSSKKKDQNQQKNGTGDLTDDLGSAASEATETVQNAAGGLTETLRQQITGPIATQQERVVDLLDTVALLLHKAGENAQEADKESIRTYVGKAADQVEGFADTIRERDADQLLKETKELAQNKPGLFVGGALVAGFLAARFLKSSSETQQSNGQQEQSSEDTDYQTPAGYERAFEQDATTGFTDTTPPAVPPVGTVVEAPLASDATTGLEGTLLDEDAAILRELEEEERILQENEALGGTTSGDPLDPETR